MRKAYVVAVLVNFLIGLASLVSIVHVISTTTTPGSSSWELPSSRSTAIIFRKTTNALSDHEDAPPSQSPSSLLHIVHSRFMQDQGQLVHLARARLELFKTFCLPSLAHQSSSNFLWIIKTDPDLEESVREELVALLKPYPHFFLAASNQQNLVCKGDRSWRSGVEGRELMEQLGPELVYSGNRTLLKHAYDIRNEVAVLETRLDADDGLHTDFIQTIQQQALSEFQLLKDQRSQQSSDRKDWMFWCVESHAEWHGAITSENATHLPREGILNVERHEAYCVSAGITVGYNVGTSEVPRYPHHKLYKGVRKQGGCGSTIDTNATVCVRLLSDLAPIAAIRPRTPTSAGMSHVWLNTTAEMLPPGQDELWLALDEKFKISKQASVLVGNYIERNLAQIAKDNLAGQCTASHSCKSSTKKLLKNIVEGETSVMGEPALLPQLIHIVHTRFMQHQGHLRFLTRARLEQFKSVCFPSILHQNSSNFLWIIKSDPNLDASARAELVDLLRPHPRFFLVDSLNNYNERLTNRLARLEGSWRGGEEGEELLRQLNPESIHSGDRTLLQRAYDWRNDVPVLETILDADDGLNTGFIDKIQKDAASVFDQSSDSPKQWMYWCVQSLVEWRAALSATVTPADPREGILNVRSPPNLSSCSTAGLTIGYNVGTTSVPIYAHNVLAKYMKENNCSLHSNNNNNITKSSCLQVLNDSVISAIRSRTITSAGMGNLVTGGSPIPDSELSPDRQAELWKILKEAFQISKAAVLQTNQYIRSNLVEIANDNLQGQCSEGHSCKGKSRNKLAHVISMTENATEDV